VTCRCRPVSCSPVCLAAACAARFASERGRMSTGVTLDVAVGDDKLEIALIA
jgi:hypothetical protein